MLKLKRKSWLACVGLLASLSTACSVTWNQQTAKPANSSDTDGQSPDRLKIGAALTDLWTAKDGADDNMLLVAPTAPENSFCFFKRIHGVNWDEEGSFGQVQMEFWKGKAVINDVGQTVVLQMEKTESSCDGLREVSDAEAKHFLPTAGEGTQELRMDNLVFKRAVLGDDRKGAVKNVASLLWLLDQSQKGCYINGKFVANANYKPSC